MPQWNLWLHGMKKMWNVYGVLWKMSVCSNIHAFVIVLLFMSFHQISVAGAPLVVSSSALTCQWFISLWLLFIVASVCLCLTCLLLFVIGEFLHRATVAETADWTGQPFSQSVSGTFRTGRAGRQRAEGRLRLKVSHWLCLPIGATDRIVFCKESREVQILVRTNHNWII